MESDDGPDSRARSGGLHWRPFHSWYCHRGLRTSPIGTCLLLRLPHPGDYLCLQEVSLASGDKQRALAPPMPAPSASQVTLLLHQPRPSHPATPYQQAVQPPRRPVGRGGAAKLPSNRATPAAGQPTQDRRRQQARGQGVRGQSASCPGGA